MAPSSQVVVLMGHCVYGMLTQGTVLQFLKDIPKRFMRLHFRRMVESSPARVGMEQFDYGIHIIVNISQPLQQSHSVFHTLILFYPDPVGAVRNADRIWVSTPQNRTLCVNLRKELVCSRAIHCASYIQRKEAQ